jgi:hypothetical protein
MVSHVQEDYETRKMSTGTESTGGE